MASENDGVCRESEREREAARERRGVSVACNPANMTLKVYIFIYR